MFLFVRRRVLKHLNECTSLVVSAFVRSMVLSHDSLGTSA